MFLLKASEIKEADRYTIEKIGIPGIVLMENAGIAVVRALNEMFPPEEIRKVIVFCGKGNNGGDGFVTARHLSLAGDDVDIVLLGERKHLSGDAATNMKIADALGIALLEIKEIADLEKAGVNLDDYDIIIDALLGTGIQKPAESLYAYVIELINNSVSYVISVDIPSGLSTDTGELMGPAVEADLTVTFAYPKICHILPPAGDLCGELAVADISIPDEAVHFEKGKREIITPDMLEGIIEPRDSDSHKGDYGHLLVIAGSMGKLGAPAMTARSASLSGAGLVTIVAPALCIPVIQTKLTEEMAFALEDEGKGYFIEKNADAIPLLEKHTALAVGPGMGRNEETARFVRRFLPLLTAPVVLDADGLNAFQGHTELFSTVKVPLILTPHPGEFARLTGQDTLTIHKNRLDMATEYAAKWKSYLILKGHRTVVATPEGDLYINMTGNPGMAKGGSGDVLTGVIGGLLASGIPPLDAALLGVYIHGMAGDIAIGEKSEVSLCANDLMESLSLAFETV
jgi:hydroxyethylthiazole kinase-like uncharacterized protein yjeF